MNTIKSRVDNTAVSPVTKELAKQTVQARHRTNPRATGNTIRFHSATHCNLDYIRLEISGLQYIFFSGMKCMNNRKDLVSLKLH